MYFFGAPYFRELTAIREDSENKGLAKKGVYSNSRSAG